MTTEPKQAEEQSPDGDYVPFGYGHPAHKPDPEAKYGFKPESRPLPVHPNLRWRVTG